MSPRKVRLVPTAAERAVAARLALQLGTDVRDERQRRGWSQTHLAARAGVSVSMVHGVESGEAASLDGYSRLAVAFRVEPRFTLRPERSQSVARDVDPVHAAIGEVEAAHLTGHGFEVRLDEPYQHYQFAGRADLVAIDHERRALLHLENRTRFPDIQAFAGSFNAKRAYLADELAARFAVAGGWASVTHVVVALWSSEVLHTLRLREASFRAVSPDPPDAFAAWWAGTPPQAGRPPRAGTTSSLVLFDPLPGSRASRRRWVGLEALRTVDPRYRGYADTLTAMRASGLV